MAIDANGFLQVRRTGMVSGETMESLKQGLQKVLRRLSRETQAAGAEKYARKHILGDQPQER